jgi:hypothetical protein
MAAGAVRFAEGPEGPWVGDEDEEHDGLGISEGDAVVE